jgi:cell division protein FtsQ
MKKTLWFWLSFLLAIMLAVYFSVRIITVRMGHGRIAEIKNIRIVADMPDANLSEIAAAAGVAAGTDSYDVSLSDINNRIARIPDVKTSAVRRMPNGNLSVRVALHHAIAVWTDGENYFPLAADGTIIERPLDSVPEHTVIFRGKIPGDVSDIARAANQLQGDIEYMEFIEGRRWNIITRGGITVMLPEAAATASINALVMMDKNNRILERDIKILDMRDTSRVLVK